MNNQQLPQKIPKLRSKKGLSLVELIVGITIIAMVMASAAGAIVTGYKTTIDNAQRNQAAANCASLNEIIMRGISKNTGFTDSTEANKYFFTVEDAAGNVSPTNPNLNPDDSVFQSAKDLFPNLYYCTDTNFPDDEHDVQYQLDLNKQWDMLDGGATVATIQGIGIRTVVRYGNDYVEIESFLPYYE